MSQDNKKSFVMYQGDGSNNVFSVPMTKGKYGTISVAFVRRGLDQYEYNPDTWGLNGGLFAWDLSGTKVYTDTATPAIGATIYDQYGVDTGDTVTAVGGATITVNTNVYTRDTLHDVDENTVLTWTGDTLQIGDYIVIERTTTRTQPFEFQNNQKHIEKSDDNLERQIQEVADKVDNALLVDPTHTIDSNKMNPVEWMKTILRSVDKSVRGFRYLNGWLDYSLDDPNIADVDKTWTHLVNTDNIKAIREQSRIEDGETIYWTEYLAQDGSWKILSRGDMIKLSDLADADFTNLSAGNFIMFDGLKWKNVYSSATASWGTLIGDITDQTDLFNTFVKKTGDTLTGMYKHNYGSRVRFMANNSTVNYTDLFMNGPEFEILFHTNNNTYDGLYGRATNGYVALYPGTDNQAWLGLGGRRWKKVWATELCPDTTNILTIPNKTGILATKGDVDLAANSGDQLTEKGVWYAKMYSATVAPSAEDGTNYADFSQTDGQGNPIIVIYKRQNGAWVQDQTITPPAEYNGYVPVTSKIWDIVEQSGQQGGKVLWSHNQKTFTPSPLIISFEDIEITGDSTVIMPQTPGTNQIVNKNYVDEAIAEIPTGGANTDLSNLTATGANIGNWSANVSNCITNIPQDIKLELNNGTLTLKAGSKVYVPNGSGNFDIYTESIDKNIDLDVDGKRFICVNANHGGLNARPVQNSVSGAGATTTAGFAYNTTTNQIRFYNDSGVDPGFKESFPIAIVTVSGGTITSIDQVFNGFGYIGSTVFALPGVKCLIPDGKNSDGSLKNIEYTIPSVKTYTSNVNQLGRYLIGNDGNIYWIAAESEYYEQATMPFTPAADKYGLWYNPDTNLMLRSWNNESWTKASWTTFARVNGSSNKITSLKPKTVFHAVDYNDTDFIAHQAMPSATYLDVTVGSAGTQYTAPADGYYSVHAVSTANNGYIELVSDTKLEFGNSASAQNGVVLRTFIPVTKGEIIRLWYNNVTFEQFRFYYANGAV